MNKNTKKRFFLNCREAFMLSNKFQYKEGSFIDRLKLKLHLFFCKHCRNYAKQNTLLAAMLYSHLSAVDKKRMPESEKEKLEKILEKEKPKASNKEIKAVKPRKRGKASDKTVTE